MKEYGYDFKGNLSIKKPSYTVLACLENILDNKHYNGEKEIDIKSFAFYNGRERSIGLEIRLGFLDKNPRIVIFGEHRNSDDIFVDTWQGKDYYNYPTINDMPDSAYDARKYFKWDEPYKVAQYIYDNFIKILEMGE